MSTYEEPRELSWDEYEANGDQLSQVRWRNLMRGSALLPGVTLEDPFSMPADTTTKGA